MCGSFLTQLFSFLSPGVPMLHVKPESRLKCQPQRGKMLLGTFKTVFNSVFLVPTKTNTPHHMAKMERCSALKSGREMKREREGGGTSSLFINKDSHSRHQALDWLCFIQQAGERKEGNVGWSAIGQSVCLSIYSASTLVQSLIALNNYLLN